MIHSIQDRADGSIAVWVENAKECCVCGNPHFFFINRDGETRCVFCDDKREKREKEKRVA